MNAGRGGFRIESTLDLARSPDDVFEFLADTRNFKAVDAALVEYEPEGRMIAGMSGRFLHRRGGFPARTTWRVTELEAPGRLSIEIHGLGYAMTEGVELEPIATGTRARFVEQVWPTTLAGRLMVALSGGIMRRDLRARAARLKAVLETT